MRVALIGLGAWGANHAKTLRQMHAAGEVEEILFCDADVGRAKAAAGPVPYTTSADEVFRDPSVDAVIVATPASSHHDLGVRALEAGKHLLVEKPLARTPKESARLVEVAEATGRTLQVGHIFRYHAAVEKVRELIADGTLGELLYLSTERTAFRIPRRDDGVLISVLIHDLDLYCLLAGAQFPESLVAVTKGFADPTVDEVGHVHMSFASGVEGYAFASWRTPGPKTRRLQVVGTRRAAIVDYMEHGRIQLYDGRHHTDPSAAEPAQEIVVPAQAPLQREIASFLRAAETGTRPLADGASGHRAVAMAAAAYLSAARRAPLDAAQIRAIAGAKEA